MNFWETKEWNQLKNFIAKTDKILNKVEYLRLVGWKNFNDEKYLKYLEAMESNNKVYGTVK